MYSEARKVVNCCESCALRKSPKVHKQEDLEITANKPFELIMMDIYGPLPITSKGYQYILAIVDVYSRYPMLIPLKRINAHIIMDTLFRKWIAIFGYSEKIGSDNATYFTAEILIEFCNVFGIKQIFSSPYHPQGNSIVERLSRTVKDRVFATCHDLKNEWNEALPLIEMGLRATRLNKSKYSPNEIIFGVKTMLPWR